MDDFQKQYEEMLRKDHEEKEQADSLTVGELIEVLKQVDPNSIVKISDWNDIFTIKSTNINNGTVFLNTFKN